MPSSRISLSYFSCTAPVMSVAMMPGRTSNTVMPCSASRAANSFVIMPRPAFVTQ